MLGSDKEDTLIGKKAQELRGLLKIKYPMEHGIVTDWEDMEKIWRHVYEKELGTPIEEVSSGWLAGWLTRKRSSSSSSQSNDSTPCSSPNRL